jgi:hypothetical protein
MNLDEPQAHTESGLFPIHCSEEEIQQCVDSYTQEQEKMEGPSEMKDLIGTNSLG